MSACSQLPNSARISSMACALADATCLANSKSGGKGGSAVLSAEYVLTRLVSRRSVDRVASDLQQLGWLGTLHLKGLWSLVPAGEVEVIDPYLDLRGWRLRDDATFALAGEAAAWHLGYLPHRYAGAVSVWVPAGARLPHGLRSHFRVVRLGWTEALAPRLGPSTRLHRAKGLDLTRWAGGLSDLGPEALLIQTAARPGSFRAWADLIPRLESFRRRLRRQ